MTAPRGSEPRTQADRTAVAPSCPRLTSTGVVCLLLLPYLLALVTDPLSSARPVIAGVGVLSALIVTGAFALLRSTLNDSAETSRSYAERAADAEATVRHDQEVAHEMCATTAGIVAGAHLLASDRIPPGPRRTALAHMVDVEAERIGRGFGRSRGDPSTVAVDEVIAPLLVAQSVLGHQVSWQPSGHLVRARRDDLAEVIHVLLSNAARHGLSRGTRITSQEVGGSVQIRVSDRGPGLAPEVRDRLFQWGARGPHSLGQGIGLQRARSLADQYGGQLVVEEPGSGPGAVFLLCLRSEGSGRGDVGAVDGLDPLSGLAR